LHRIKVLFTIPNFDTAGSGKVLYDLATNLNPSFFEVEIACNHAQGDFFEVVKSTGLKIHIVDFTIPFRPYLTLLKRLKPVIQFFKENNFDIIHSWHWSSDWTEPLGARIARIPWLYTKKAMSWGNKHWQIRSRMANHIVTINKDMNSQFFPGWSKTSYIPLGLDTTYYHPQSHTRTFPNDVKFEEGDFVMVSVANLVPVKGVELAIEALKRINQKRLKYLIVGNYDNEYGKGLIEKIQKHGLSDQVIFSGRVLDVRPYLAGADLFVIPTKNEGRKEGMPMAPVEAMASERLVIGSRIPGITDILSGFEELLFEPGDVTALMKRILQVMKMSEQERIDKANDLFKKTREQYTLQQFLSAHEELYTRLAKN